MKSKRSKGGLIEIQSLFLSQPSGSVLNREKRLSVTDLSTFLRKPSEVNPSSLDCIYVNALCIYARQTLLLSSKGLSVNKYSWNFPILELLCITTLLYREFPFSNDMQILHLTMKILHSNESCTSECSIQNSMKGKH